MAALGRRLEPWLRRVHPGYFLVVASLIIIHSVLAVDDFLPGRHDAPVFHYMRLVLVPLGLAHIVIVVALIAALYLPMERWWLGRWGCLVSLVTFNATAMLLFVGITLEPHASISQPALYIALSMSSAAAMREPLVRTCPDCSTPLVPRAVDRVP